MQKKSILDSRFNPVINILVSFDKLFNNWSLKSSDYKTFYLRVYKKKI